MRTRNERSREQSKNKGASAGLKAAVRLALSLLAAAIIASIPQADQPGMVSASFNATLLEGRSLDDKITNDDREVAYVFLLEHTDSLRALYDISPEAEQRMRDVLYEANVYLANTDLTVSQLNAYVNSVESNLTAAAAVNIVNAHQFLFVSNSSEVTSASYGQPTTLSLSLVNLGQADITDIVVTPVVNTDIRKYPFVIQTASDARVISRLRASTVLEEAQALQQTVSWDFVVSPEAKTGTYELPFHVIYYRNGEIEERDVTTYIHIHGAPDAGRLDGEEDEEDRTSTPRIIVTGFRTEPEVVNAGDTFELTIFVQNTSMETAVSNIQFDLKAAQEGEKSENTYEAFLPTSGSATIFVRSIPAGQETAISIEMTARGDLTQKPYVITVNAAYEDDRHNPYTAATNVSIPVRQPARVDTGDAEILPDYVEVGGSSNIMFSIYNMGKTTLYNVQVSYEGDTIDGGNTFIGKIEPGATGNVDSMVNAVAPTQDDGTIRAVISYEDESGNVTSFTKELTLYTYEPDYSDWEDYGDYGDWEEPMPEDGGSHKGLIIGGIGAGVVIGAVIGIIIAVKKKKKRRQAELDALEDDEI